MEPNTDKEMQELMEEIAEDLGYASKKQEGNGLPLNGRKRRGGKRVLLMGAVAAAGLIIVSMWIFGGNEVPQANGGLAALTNRLDQLEARLARLEEIKGRLTYIEEQEKGTNQFLTSAEASVRSLKERLDLMGQKTERLEQSVASLRAAPSGVSAVKGNSVAVTPPPKAAAVAAPKTSKVAHENSKAASPSQGSRPQAGKRFHDVKRGDTLYSIAKSYSLTVDELRRINHLSAADTIHPGQKLSVN